MILINTACGCAQGLRAHYRRTAAVQDDHSAGFCGGQRRCCATLAYKEVHAVSLGRHTFTNTDAQIGGKLERPALALNVLDDTNVTINAEILID